ncbi:MAG: DUF2516 family protein [Actinomycetota bacterium]|nr:DUF2516 family protein [Actinomycetota bacterium]
MVHLIFSLIWLGTLGLKAWALVDCVTRPTPTFELYGKLTKGAWLAILAVAALTGFAFSPLGIFGIAGTVAAIVYLVDVRPAVSGRSTL